MARTKKKEQQTMQLPKPDRRLLEVTVQGDTPLYTHSYDPRTIKRVAEKQEGKAQTKKPPKIPTEEYMGALYWLDKDGDLMMPGTDVEKHKTGFGIKSMAFKLSMIEAGYQMLDMQKTKLRCPFFVLGAYVRIEGKPKMAMDPTRVQGKLDLRYRPKFMIWKTTLRIEYDANVITDEQLVHLLDNAGFGVGVGDWRPQKNGVFGRFHVGNVKTTRPRKRST